jgi:DNA repair photolyase
MSIIYEPKGKAREYSPLACNIYDGCNHGCKYCYAPSIRYKTREDYYNVSPRRNILQELENDCKKYCNTDKQVLLTFMSDPYNKLESELRLTRESLKLLYKYNIPVAILTKSRTVLNDLDIIKKFGDNIQVGMTLTFDNDKDSLEWEKEASLPCERIEILKQLKENKIKTWASFEPVIDVWQSLNMINKSLEYVDIYKIGKINNYNGIDKTIDWNDFLDIAVNTLRKNKKPFYVKHDLRIAANKIKLYGNECLMDEFCIKPEKTLFD